MKKQQSGFTLIELIVVIVILGILAATALPRFTGLTTQANEAVANGVLGSVMSAAVIQYGVFSGNSVSWATIVDNVDVSGVTGNPFEVNVNGSNAAWPNSTATCAAGANPIIVTVGTSTATGSIPNGLCEN